MNNKIVAEVSIVPLGTDTTSMSEYVAESVKALQKYSDVAYEVTAMCTVLEGPLDRVLAAVERMHDAPFDKGAKRVITHIRIDDRRDKPTTMESKVGAVKKKVPTRR